MTILQGIARGGRHLTSRFTDNAAAILYHRVADVEVDPFGLCVSPANFEEQIAQLAAMGQPLSVGQLIRRRDAGRFPRGAFCVTFDDGFVDVRDAALPVLERHGVPAVVYCVSGNLGGRFWWDRLADLVFGADALPDELVVGGGVPPVPTLGRRRDRLMRELHGLLGAVSTETREHRLAELTGQLGAQAPARDTEAARTLTPEELAEFAAHPLITIGAHTVSHPRLAALDRGDQRREIEGSVERLSEIAGRVSSFSYPFGLRGRDFDAATEAAARDSGLDHALAADRGVINHRSGAFRLPRLWAKNCGGERFLRGVRRWL